MAGRCSQRTPCPPAVAASSTQRERRTLTYHQSSMRLLWLWYRQVCRHHGWWYQALAQHTDVARRSNTPAAGRTLRLLMAAACPELLPTPRRCCVGSTTAA